jgi:hypothetical protein
MNMTVVITVLASKIGKGRIVEVLEELARNGASSDVLREIMTELMRNGMVDCRLDGGGRCYGAGSTFVDPDKIRYFLNLCHASMSNGHHLPDSFVIGKIKTGKNMVVNPTSLFTEAVYGRERDEKIKGLLSCGAFYQAIDIAARHASCAKIFFRFMVEKELISTDREINLENNELLVKQFVETCRLLKLLPKSSALMLPDQIDFVSDEKGDRIVLSIKRLKEKMLLWERYHFGPGPVKFETI